MKFLLLIWNQIRKKFSSPVENIKSGKPVIMKETPVVGEPQFVEKDPVIAGDGPDEDWFADIMVGSENLIKLKRIAAEYGTTTKTILKDDEAWGLSIEDTTRIILKQLSKIPILDKNMKILNRVCPELIQKDAKTLVQECRIAVLRSPAKMFKDTEEHIEYLNILKRNIDAETAEQDKRFSKLYDEERVADKLETLELLRNFNIAPPRVEIVGRTRQGDTLTQYNAWTHIKAHPIKKYIVLDTEIRTTDIYGTKGLDFINTADLLKIPVAIGFYGNNSCKFTGFNPLGKKVRGVYLPGHVKETWVGHTKELRPGGKIDFHVNVIAEYDNNKFLPVAEKAHHLRENSFNNVKEEIVRLYGIVVHYMLKLKDVWTIEITDTDSGITMIFPAGLTVIKELCRLRDNPLTEKGNRKSILHTVATHSRITSAGTTTVKRYLRGVYQFGLCGYNIMIAPPAVELLNASEKKIEEFRETLPWHLYKNIPGDFLCQDYLKLIGGVGHKDIVYTGKSYDLSALNLHKE